VAVADALDGDRQQLVEFVVVAKTREGGQRRSSCAQVIAARRSGATAAVPLAGGQTHP